MLDLTFGEQVKIILSRKGMTIKELAETIEAHTGKKMSRQNLTQRLGRDNFQEQDMRMIAGILGCPFHLNILDDGASAERSNHIEPDRTLEVSDKADASKVVQKEEKRELPVQEAPASESAATERDITIGELVDIHEELDAMIEQETGELPPLEAPVEELLEEMAAIEEENKAGKRETQEEREEREKKSHGWKSYLLRRKKKNDEEEKQGNGLREIYPEEDENLAKEEDAKDLTEGILENSEENVKEGAYEYQEEYAQEYEDEYATAPEEIEEARAPEEEEDRIRGDVNPYTGREYESNSVRMHPNRIGYVQVYDRSDHKWTDMTEWAFLGSQERKKALLGKDYEPPIYLD